MKKISLLSICIICVMLFLVGCGNKESDLTMDEIKSTFEENGYIYNEEKEPMFSLIGAKSGAWFDKEGVTKTVVYEYADKKSLDAAIKENDFMSEFKINGLFMLETSDDEIKTIFNDL